MHLSLSAPPSPFETRVRALRPDLADPVARTAAWIRAVLGEVLLDLPLPGRGDTGERFAALADLGSVDLDLARLAEAHLDAAAIRADLMDGASGSDGPGGGSDGVGLWGVWAANPPVDPLLARNDSGGWRLTGSKPWCSGAGCCDRALVTARTDDGYRLFAVEQSRPGVVVVDGTWPASAMQGSDSRSVRYDDVPAVVAGEPEAYLRRAGFWHGAVGVAAVWWGGARGVARALAAADVRRPLHPHALAHAGAVDAALAAAAALLDHAARAFDDDPEDKTGSARLLAGRVRAAVERSAVEVVERTGRALGAAPLALDAEHGRRVADLGLYLRQSHAERDLEELGRASLGGEPR